MSSFVTGRLPFSLPQSAAATAAMRRLDSVKSEACRTPHNALIGTGAMLLLMLCVVPVWNAFLLLHDANYVFWGGKWTPTCMIILCASIFCVYIATLWIFFAYSAREAQTDQTIMMIATIFITLLGLGFMLVSLPLSRQARATYTNLMHRCDYSLETHRIYQVSQVLQNIRRMPGCADKYSVKECPGYREVPPYTEYLETLENEFFCSGFCISWEDRSADATEPAALLEVHSSVRKNLHREERVAGANSFRMHDEDRVLALDVPNDDMALAQVQGVGVNSYYPPTLFSDTNYEASCEGAAARSLINFAGDVGFQTFYQGIYLVIISISMGAYKLLSYCSHRGLRK